MNISTIESLNQAHASLLKQQREVNYALAAVEIVSAGQQLAQGLLTTEELLNGVATLSMRALDLDKLKPGDTDLITGQIIPTKEESEALLARITG